MRKETQPMYCWNGTPLVIPAEPRKAEAYNRRLEQFEEAQVRFKEENGFDWDPTQPITMPDDLEAHEAYNEFADVLNALVRFSGGGIAFYEEDMDESGLVRIN